MQKLDFNKDGKLVAYTDNGCTDGKSATTELKGTFEVSANLAKFILAKEYDLSAQIRIQLDGEEMFGYCYPQFLNCYIGNNQKLLESLSRKVDKQQKELESYKHRVDELSNAEVELKRLKRAIDDFNQNARFYERKLKI